MNRRRKWNAKPPLGQARLDPADTLSDGLVGRWIFNEGAGKTVSDLSGNGNNGTLTNGPTWIPTKFGVALEFDGVDDVVAIDSFPTMSAPFSFSAWMKPDVSAATDKISYVIVGNNVNFYIKWDSNFGPNETLGFFSTTGSNVNVSIGTVNTAQWHHIVGTYDGTTLKAYNNGLKVSTLNNSLVPIGGGSSASIGKNFDGTIDDVRIYNRALRSDEIIRLYQDPYQGLLPRRIWPVAGASVAGGVTGTGEGILKSFTGSSSGTVDIITGLASGTLNAFTGSASGSVNAAITGTGVGALFAFTGSASGVVGAVTGTGDGALSAFTGAGTGTVDLIAGTGAGDLLAFTGSSSGTVDLITGTVDANLGAIFGSASGTVATGNITGSADGILQAFVGDASGVVNAATGTGTGVLQDFTGVASGTVDIITGTGTGDLSAFTGSASGDVDLITGVVAATLSALTGSASGNISSPGAIVPFDQTFSVLAEDRTFSPTEDRTFSPRR